MAPARPSPLSPPALGTQASGTHKGHALVLDIFLYSPHSKMKRGVAQPKAEPPRLQRLRIPKCEEDPELGEPCVLFRTRFLRSGLSFLLGLGAAGGMAMPSILGQGCHVSSLSQGVLEDMAMCLSSELGTQRNNRALR